MKKYKLVCKKGEGTFSEVVKAENTETGNHYAIKCMKTAFDSANQVSECVIKISFDLNNQDSIH
jgi:renal tumor antigen